MLFYSRCFFHSGDIGDIIYSIPTVIALGGGTYWIRNSWYYPYLASLLLSVKCIGRVSYYNGQLFRGAYNLDLFREIAEKELSVLLTLSHLQKFGVDFAISGPWLFVEPKYVADIVISVSPRFHDVETIDWQLLHGYNLGFIGRDDDYDYFYGKTKLEMKRIYVQDALEVAQIIRGSKLFLGNQSSGFAIAEGLKHPRVLEVFTRAPNCMPQGKYGHTVLSNEIIEKYIVGLV